MEKTQIVSPAGGSFQGTEEQKELVVKLYDAWANRFAADHALSKANADISRLNADLAKLGFFVEPNNSCW